jgi:hypothetical protein
VGAEVASVARLRAERSMVFVGGVREGRCVGCRPGVGKVEFHAREKIIFVCGAKWGISIFGDASATAFSMTKYSTTTYLPRSLCVLLTTYF